MSAITLNGRTVDPLALAVAPAGLPVAPPPSDHALIQTAGPLTAAHRMALHGAGMTDLERVGEDTYLGTGSPAATAAAAALPFVRWSGPYLLAFKLPPALTPGAPAVMGLAEALVGPPPIRIDVPCTVDVVFHRSADAAATTTAVAQAAGLDPAVVDGGPRKVRLTAPMHRLAAIAAIDGVRQVEQVVPVKLHDDVARRVLRIDAPNPGTLPFDGAGQVIGVADTGLDRGDPVAVHPAFAGRVAGLVARGRPGDASDPHGHGTHVAGSAVGDAHSAALGFRLRGTAPGAQLVLQSVLDRFGGLGGLGNDLQVLLDEAYAAGVRVHCDSWGSTVGDGRYDAMSADVDAYVWDHRDLVVCIAAGNEGQDGGGAGRVDPRSITPPATARNCVTVGASENDRPGFALTYGQGWPTKFPASPIGSDRTADQPGGMAAFSSRGPTADGRIKPDVVAPGTFVLSARSRRATGTGWGASADPLYMFDGGTSMATPLVAGCCALVRQWLIAHGFANPSAALVKAMLINGAVDLPGQYVPSEAAAPPNFAEGFGRVDMDATIGAGAASLVVRDEGPALDAGEEHRLQLALVTDPSRLKVTLVWTDAPGPVLQNDLDLAVLAAGSERHGNVAAGSLAFDRTNNVEQVDWDGLPPGPVEIVVRAARIVRPQSYALVVRPG